MQESLRRAVSVALGSAVKSARPVTGGDINEAFEVGLADRRHVFIKTNSGTDPRMFPAEARGLAWLDETRALRVPKVLCVSAEDESGATYIALEFLRTGRPRPDMDETLGRGLAALHRSGAASFGLDHDNFIGRLPQFNVPSGSWSEFYRRERLERQLRLGLEQRRIDSNVARDFEGLFAKLDDLVGQPEPPARLHGDLWGGNLLVDESGAPCLIDPAVYGGHREIDLAMMRLFGGFNARVFDAYEEVHPLSQGHEERLPLYQLYPLLVHVNLFGGSYLSSVKGVLRRYV